MTPAPFSVRIFLQDGHADGVKIVARSKWPGRALVIPRTSLADEFTRPELRVPGVYILVGPVVEDSLQPISIGSAERLCDALEEEDHQQRFWDRVVVFASKDNGLTLAQAEYFESCLKRLAVEGSRASINKLDQIKAPVLEEAAQADTELFLEHILSLCPLLGIIVFDEVKAGQTKEQ